jgi:hypothetical protein
VARLLAVLTVAVILGLSPAAQAPKGEKKLLYFPTRVGDKRVYETNFKNGRQEKHVSTVTKVEEKDGAKVVTLETFNDDDRAKLTAPSTYRVSEEGVFNLSKWDLKRDPPICLLKLPHKPGTKWEVSFGDDDKSVHTHGKVERVEVPAGVYQAIRVDIVLTSGGREYRGTEWHTPGVGRVKATDSLSEDVLISFTPGKE